MILFIKLTFLFLITSIVSICFLIYYWDTHISFYYFGTTCFLVLYFFLCLNYGVKDWKYKKRNYNESNKRFEKSIFPDTEVFIK